MKIRMNCGIAGADFSYAPGEIADFPQDQARALIDKGMAEHVKGDKTATRAKRETATTRKGKDQD